MFHSSSCCFDFRKHGAYPTRSYEQDLQSTAGCLAVPVLSHEICIYGTECAMLNNSRPGALNRTYESLFDVSSRRFAIPWETASRERQRIWIRTEREHCQRMQLYARQHGVGTRDHVQQVKNCSTRRSDSSKWLVSETSDYGGD